MKMVTYLALMDELSQLEKEAGILQNLGTKMMHGVKAAPAALQRRAQGSIRDMGGAINAFANPIQSMRTGASTMKNDWGKMGLPMKALMAYGLYSGGKEAISKNDPTGQGRGRGERVGAFLGDQAGTLIGAPFNLAGGVLAGAVGRKVGGTVGKVVDVARGVRKKPRFDPMGDQPTAAMPQIEVAR